MKEKNITGRYFTNSDETSTIEVDFGNGVKYSTVIDPKQHEDWHWMALNNYWGKLYHTSRKAGLEWKKQSKDGQDENLDTNMKTFRQHLKDSGFYKKIGGNPDDL